MADFVRIISFILLIVAMQTTTRAFGGGRQWQGQGQGQAQSKGNGHARGANFQSSAGGQHSNGWQKNSASAAGGSDANGASSPYSSNVYDTGDKYGYDYAIPGAKVHFAASRGAGGLANGNSNGGGSGGRWNDFARKQSQGNGQHSQAGAGAGNRWRRSNDFVNNNWQNALDRQENDAGNKWQSLDAGAALSVW